MGSETSTLRLGPFRFPLGVMTDSAWDPRVLLTLETRMEHGFYEWCAASAAEVSGRAA